MEHHGSHFRHAPYARKEVRKSIFSKVRDSMKDILSPSWISELVYGVKKESSTSIEWDSNREAVPGASAEVDPSGYQQTRISPFQNPSQALINGQPRTTEFHRRDMTTDESGMMPFETSIVCPSAPPASLQVFTSAQLPLSRITEKSDSVMTQDTMSQQSDVSRSTSGCSSMIPQTIEQSKRNVTSEKRKATDDKDLLEGSSFCSSSHDQPLAKRPKTHFGGNISFSKCQSDSFMQKAPAEFVNNHPFNASLFGSPLNNESSLLGSSFHESSFYPGKTTYGGKSSMTYRSQKNKDLNLSLPSRSSIPVKAFMKAKPRLNLTKEAVTSSTARRIMDILDKMPTPLNDAKKIPLIVPLHWNGSPSLIKTTTQSVLFGKAVGTPTTNRPDLGTLFKATGWTCVTCLLNNKMNVENCVACQTAKPNAQKPKAEGTFSAGRLFLGNWICGTCQIQNKADAVICGACKATKIVATPSCMKADTICHDIGASSMPDAAKTSNMTLPSAGGFVFNSTGVTAEDISKTSGFKFDASNSKDHSNNFKDSKTSEDGFKFSTSTDTTSSGGFKFGTKSISENSNTNKSVIGTMKFSDVQSSPTEFKFNVDSSLNENKTEHKENRSISVDFQFGKSDNAMAEKNSEPESSVATGFTFPSTIFSQKESSLKNPLQTTVSLPGGFILKPSDPITRTKINDDTSSTVTTSSQSTGTGGFNFSAAKSSGSLLPVGRFTFTATKITESNSIQAPSCMKADTICHDIGASSMPDAAKTSNMTLPSAGGFVFNSTGVTAEDISKTSGFKFDASNSKDHSNNFKDSKTSEDGFKFSTSTDTTSSGGFKFGTKSISENSNTNKSVIGTMKFSDVQSSPTEFKFNVDSSLNENKTEHKENRSISVDFQFGKSDNAMAEKNSEPESSVATGFTFPSTIFSQKESSSKNPLQTTVSLPGGFILKPSDPITRTKINDDTSSTVTTSSQSTGTGGFNFSAAKSSGSLLPVGRFTFTATKITESNSIQAPSCMKADTICHDIGASSMPDAAKTSNMTLPSAGGFVFNSTGVTAEDISKTSGFKFDASNSKDHSNNFKDSKTSEDGFKFSTSTDTTSSGGFKFGTKSISQNSNTNKSVIGTMKFSDVQSSPTEFKFNVDSSLNENKTEHKENRSISVDFQFGKSDNAMAEKNSEPESSVATGFTFPSTIFSQKESSSKNPLQTTVSLPGGFILKPSDPITRTKINDDTSSTVTTSSQSTGTGGFNFSAAKSSGSLLPGATPVGRFTFTATKITESNLIQAPSCMKADTICHDIGASSMPDAAKTSNMTLPSAGGFVFNSTGVTAEDISKTSGFKFDASNSKDHSNNFKDSKTSEDGFKFSTSTDTTSSGVFKFVTKSISENSNTNKSVIGTMKFSDVQSSPTEFKFNVDSSLNENKTEHKENRSISVDFQFGKSDNAMAEKNSEPESSVATGFTFPSTIFSQKESSSKNPLQTTVSLPGGFILKPSDPITRTKINDDTSSTVTTSSQSTGTGGFNFSAAKSSGSLLPGATPVGRFTFTATKITESNLIQGSSKPVPAGLFGPKKPTETSTSLSPAIGGFNFVTKFEIGQKTKLSDPDDETDQPQKKLSDSSFGSTISNGPSFQFGPNSASRTDAPFSFNQKLASTTAPAHTNAVIFGAAPSTTSNNNVVFGHLGYATPSSTGATQTVFGQMNSSTNSPSVFQFGQKSATATFNFSAVSSAQSGTAAPVLSPIITPSFNFMGQKSEALSMGMNNSMFKFGQQLPQPAAVSTPAFGASIGFESHSGPVFMSGAPFDGNAPSTTPFFGSVPPPVYGAVSNTASGFGGGAFRLKTDATAAQTQNSSVFQFGKSADQTQSTGSNAGFNFSASTSPGTTPSFNFTAHTSSNVPTLTASGAMTSNAIPSGDERKIKKATRRIKR